MIAATKEKILNLSPTRFSARFEREALLILSLGISIFYLTALFSFHPYDDSILAASFPEHPLQNLAGKLGAFIAGTSIYFFGLIALLLPAPLLNKSWILLRSDEVVLGKSRIFGWILLTLSLTILCASYCGKFSRSGFYFPTGGIMGEMLARQTQSILGPVGNALFILTTMICALVMITHWSVITSLGFLRDIYILRVFIPMLEKLASFRLNLWRRGSETVDEIPAPEYALPGEVATIVDVPTRQPDPIPVAKVAMEADEPLAGFRDKLLAMKKKREEALFRKLKDEQEKETAEASPAATYTPPPVNLFRTSEGAPALNKLQIEEFETTAEALTKAFLDFQIRGRVVAIQPGPVVTVFEFEPAAGTKLAKMISLVDDIALALRVDSIFIHPVTGKRAVGVQVPNKNREMVFLGDIIQSEAFDSIQSPLAFAMGKSLKGDPVCGDLCAMPHLLMAGQTGAGKSVAINSLLCSVIMKASPDEARMILVDPKILELKIYEGIPHLLMPVITEPTRAAQALKWACVEMDRRYKLMELARVRHLSGFNSFWDRATDEEKTEIQAIAQDDAVGKMPFILIVIDELADLMLTAPKEVENYIQRLAQKARACGIHLVLATQRPSVDVITGVIKANLPCRIAFKVFSRADSRTILDSMGADKLLGKGDMLYLKPGTSKLERIQGAFLSDDEVVSIVENIRANSEESYDQTAIAWIDNELSRNAAGDFGLDIGGDCDDDPKWDEAIAIGQKFGVISASFLQRHLKIGYNRAARIVEAMDAQGLVEKASGSKPRKWLGGSMQDMD